MFGGLSQGSTLYVLDKTADTPKLCIATVTAKTEIPLWTQPLQTSTVDITVSYADGNVSTFQKLPINSSIYTYEKAIVTETRELMEQTIDNSERQSQSILDSTPYHEKAVKAYKEMRKQLSPTYEKDKETNERLSSLENSIANLAEIVEKIAVSSAKSNSKTN